MKKLQPFTPAWFDAIKKERENLDIVQNVLINNPATSRNVREKGPPEFQFRKVFADHAMPLLRIADRHVPSAEAKATAKVLIELLREAYK